MDDEEEGVNQLDAAEIEADTRRIRYPEMRATLLRERESIFRLQGKEQEAARVRWLACAFGLDATTRGDARPRSGRRFDPIPQLPTEGLNALRSAWVTSANPIHRARYGDILWEQTKDYRAAIAAIESYLQAADVYWENGWDEQLADSLDRAGELSQLLRNAVLAQQSKAASLTMAGQMIRAETHPRVRWAIDVLETAQRFGRDLTEDEHEQIRVLAEQGAAFYAASGSYHLERSFLKLLPLSLNALKRTEEAQHARIRFAEAFEREAKNADSRIAEIFILNEALDAYGVAGQASKINELKLRHAAAVSESAGELTAIEVEVALPLQTIEQRVGEWCSLPPDAAMQAFAGATDFIPSVHSIRTGAEKTSSDFPLLDLASRITIDDSQHIVSNPRSDAETEWSNFVRFYRDSLRLHEVAINLAFDRLERSGRLTQETIVTFLDTTRAADPESISMITIGLERYFSGDQVSALHVLVPHLENMLRRLLPRVGISTLAYRQGITMETTLGEVLKEEPLRRALGENIAVYLEMVLTDSESLNVRNRTAHGLLSLEHCTKDMVRLIILSYLLVAEGAPST